LSNPTPSPRHGGTSILAMWSRPHKNLMTDPDAWMSRRFSRKADRT